MDIRPILQRSDEVRDFYSHETYLTSQGTALATTIIVKNINKFAINQVLLIGKLGNENSEIIKTHSSTAPSGTTITLASGLVNTHPVYTKVQVITYDYVEFSHCATTTGTKSVLTTTAIPADDFITRHDNLTQTAGYYWTRWLNSINTDYSDYNGPIPFAGMGENTVRKLIDKALKQNKLKTFTDFCDKDFCLDSLNKCLRDITSRLKNARWSKLQNFDYVLGQTSRGAYSFALPSDIWETENNKSILNVWSGREGDQPLQWKTKEEFNAQMGNVKFTDIRTAASAGETSLAIDNSYDFADSGTVYVYVSSTKYDITYTGVTRSATAGALTGVPATGDGAIDVTVAVDTKVWQDEEEGDPEYYTIYGGYLYIWPLPDASNDNFNIRIDYYTGPDSVDTDEDALDTFRYDACYHRLIADIRAMLKNDGELNLNDADFIESERIIANYQKSEKPSHQLTKNNRITPLRT